jgi:multiple sugar transport system permease protein
MLFPMLWMILSSLKTNAEITMVPLVFFPKNLQWKNFSTMVAQINMPRLFLNSLIFSGTTTISVTLTGSLAGFIFAKYRFRGKEFLFMLVLSVMMLPFTVLLVPLYIIMANLQWVDTFQGLIAPSFVTAFGIFLMRQFITSIPTDLIMSMRIDGSSELGIWSRLILPNTKPAMASLAVFTFMQHWDSFLWPLVITNTERTRILPLGVAMFFQEFLVDYNLVMAAAVVSVLPVLVLYFAAQKQLVEGLTLSGLTGI